MNAGLSRGGIRHRLERKYFVKVGHGVFSTRGAVLTLHQRILAACLQCGRHTAAGLKTAAWLWRLDGFDAPQVIELVRPRGAYTKLKGVKGVKVRSMRGFEKEGVGVVGGVPVTSLPQTLIDLARVLDEATLELALDSAIRQNKWWRSWIERELLWLGTKGRPGAPSLARLLRERPEVRDSALEVLVDRLFFATGLPRPKVQYTIVENGKRVVRADFAWPDVKVAVLAQGYQFHHGRQQFEKDSKQSTLLAAAGWLVLNPTWREINEAPAAFIQHAIQAHAEGSRRWLPRPSAA